MYTTLAQESQRLRRNLAHQEFMSSKYQNHPGSLKHLSVKDSFSYNDKSYAKIKVVMKTALLYGLSIFLILTCHTASAIQVNSLYMGEIQVHSQSSEERHRMMPTALAQVFTKVSGNNQILTNPRIKQQLPKASSLVQQFGYATSAAANTNTTYLLQIHFDINGVNQCLREANAPVWGQNRPLILGWISDESTPTQDILTLKTTNPMANLMKKNMDQRGIPFTLPNMDTTDANLITPQLITDMDIPKLLAASKRYKSDALLIGHLTKNGELLNTQWKLTLGSDQWEWNITGKTANDIIPALVDNITNTLSTRFAIVTSNSIQKNIALKIMGIHHQSDFTQLIRYLNHLTPVANVSISSVNGSDVLLSISLRSTEESFVKTLSLGQRLSAISTKDNTSPMIFQWNH